MEPTAPAHSRGYYATRTTVRAAVYTLMAAAFFAFPGTVQRHVEAFVNGLGL